MRKELRLLATGLTIAAVGIACTRPAPREVQPTPTRIEEQRIWPTAFLETYGVAVDHPRDWPVKQTNQSILIKSPELRRNEGGETTASFIVRDTGRKVVNASSARDYAHEFLVGMMHLDARGGGARITPDDIFQGHNAASVAYATGPLPNVPGGLTGFKVFVEKDGVILEIGYVCDTAVRRFTEPMLQEILDSVQFSPDLPGVKTS